MFKVLLGYTGIVNFVFLLALGIGMLIGPAWFYQAVLNLISILSVLVLTLAIGTIIEGFVRHKRRKAKDADGQQQ